MIFPFMETLSINVFTISNSFSNVMLKNLTLNWEKCHFIVRHEIVSNHEISKNGIEVDKTKIEVIAKLSVPKCIKDIRSFLGHADFYRRFIKGFSKIARPLTNFLAKNVSFTFDSGCLNAWEKLKMSYLYTNHLCTGLVKAISNYVRRFRFWYRHCLRTAYR